MVEGKALKMDAEELVEKCRAISIKDCEEDMIVMEAGAMEKGQRKTKHCLVGKVLSAKMINREAFVTTMPQIWKTIKGVKIEGMGNNVFIFQFSSLDDKRRVMNTGPWHFDKALLVLSEPEGIGEINKQTFQYASFWTQIHNIPIMCMNKGMAMILGGKIGRVEEVDCDVDGDCLGKYMRIRVAVDICKPLKKYLLVKLPQLQDVVTLPVLYEKLPEFCFRCGRLGHVFRECEEPAIKSDGDAAMEDFTYGNWMSANRLWPRGKTGNSKGSGTIPHTRRDEDWKQSSERVQPTNPSPELIVDLTGMGTGQAIGEINAHGVERQILNAEVIERERISAESQSRCKIITSLKTDRTAEGEQKRLQIQKGKSKITPEEGRVKGPKKINDKEQAWRATQAQGVAHQHMLFSAHPMMFKEMDIDKTGEMETGGENTGELEAGQKTEQGIRQNTEASTNYQRKGEEGRKSWRRKGRPSLSKAANPNEISEGKRKIDVDYREQGETKKQRGNESEGYAGNDFVWGGINLEKLWFAEGRHMEEAQEGTRDITRTNVSAEAEDQPRRQP